jgi:hypothetical protein
MKTAISIFFVLILFSCSKESTPQDDTATNESALRNNAWKLTGRVSDVPRDWDGNGTTEANIYATRTDCDNNYRYRFGSSIDGVFWNNCNASGLSFLWSLSNYGHTLLTSWQDGLVDGDGRQDIVSINNSTLVLTYKTGDSNGMIYTITDTYTKQ